MPEMDEPQRDEITALYEWAPGDCFKCARTGIPTTRIAKVTPEGDGEYDVRACQDCTMELEAMSRHAAERDGRRYEPGQLGRVRR